MHEISTQLVPLADFDKIRCVEGFKQISNEYPTYLTDESKLSPQPFDYLFFPMDEAELAAILKKMSDHNVKVTIAGARTGLVGGCVPRKGALVSLENFDRVKSITWDHHPMSGGYNVSARWIYAALMIRLFPKTFRI